MVLVSYNYRESTYVTFIDLVSFNEKSQSTNIFPTCQ